MRLQSAGRQGVGDGRNQREDRQGNKDRIWKYMQEHDCLIHVTLFDEPVECLNARFTLFWKQSSHIVRVLYCS